MAFNGYLIKFVKTGKLFPHELIAKDTYKSTPLQRTEITAFRDNNNFLHRETSPNYKSKIEFQTLRLNGSRLKKIRDVLDLAFDNEQQRKIRVALCEYLIKTYTNEGDTVLDNCMGSGSTGVACVNLNRNFIGHELDKHIFGIAENRIDEAVKSKKQAS